MVQENLHFKKLQLEQEILLYLIFSLLQIFEMLGTWTQQGTDLPRLCMGNEAGRKFPWVLNFLQCAAEQRAKETTHTIIF